MGLKADEISKIIREQISSFAVDVDVAEVGTVTSLGDGIARLHGCERAMAGEMLEFPHGVFGIALNLEEDSVGCVLLGEYREIKEGDPVKRTGRIISVPGRRGAARPRRQRAGSADRRQGPDPHQAVLADRAPGAGRRRSSAGARADADRAQGHRRHGADRPRSARADHRRPPDRQDRGRARHHPQSERNRRHLHLQRDRAEAVDDRAAGAHARRKRRAALQHRRRGGGVGSGADALHQPVLRDGDGRVLPRQQAATRC